MSISSITCQAVQIIFGGFAAVPTETLIDMLVIILADEPVLTSTDTTEVEQIQRELQRRAQKELEFLNI
jgi:hypothetical protein